MITSAIYSNRDQTNIKIEPGGWYMPWPCFNSHRKLIEEWMEEGNIIADYDPNHGKTEDQIYQELVINAESIVKSYIQSNIDAYNKSNGTNFESVYNCNIYTNQDDYPHQQFCIDIVAFNAQVWNAARQLQISIGLGETVQPETEEDFISHFPVYSGT